MQPGGSGVIRPSNGSADTSRLPITYFRNRRFPGVTGKRHSSVAQGAGSMYGKPVFHPLSEPRLDYVLLVEFDVRWT